MGAVLRIRRAIVGAFVVAAVMGVVGSGSRVSAEPFDESSYTITRNGPQLYMNWWYPHTLRGLNVSNANSAGQCGPDLQTGDLLSEALAAHGERKNVIRAWFFQSLAQTAPADAGGQRDWTAFDKTLEIAAQHGMKVIVTLSDQVGQCGDGGFKDRDWYDSGYKEEAGSGLLTTHRQFVQETVARYGFDPRIAFWELVNAPDVRLAEGGDCADDAAQVLRDFAYDLAELIKGNSWQLVSLGSAGGDQCGTAGEDFRTVHNIDPIDLCTYHDTLPGAMPGDAANGLQTRINQCTSLAKPLVVTDVRIPRGSEPEDLLARATALGEKIEAQSAAGVQGFVAWKWASESSADPTYDIEADDPLLVELRANRAPITSTVTFDAPPGQATELTILPQLADDPDGDSLEIGVITSPPGRGEVTCETTTCTYTPGEFTFDGNDEFEVEIRDSLGATTTGRVRLMIRNPLIVVNSTEDEADFNPDDGVCAVEPTLPVPPEEPTCTLRAAVQHAQRVPGRDEIRLEVGREYVLTLEGSGEDDGATGDLDVWSPDELLIIAPGSGFVRADIIAHDELGDRVFDVQQHGQLSLRSVNIIDGAAPEGENGGGMRIQASGDSWPYSAEVGLRDVGLRRNSAYDGGAVWISADQNAGARLSLTEVDVIDNDADNDGGGIWAGDSQSEPEEGSWVEVTVRDSSIAGNTADRDGGGLWAGGTYNWLELSDTRTTRQLLIEDNVARRNGGGLWVGGIGVELRVNSEEFDEVPAVERNCAGRDGGGIWVGGTDGDVRISDTHVIENGAFSCEEDWEDEEPEVLEGGNGGGIWIGGRNNDVVVRDVLLSDNRATDGGGLWASGPLEIDPEADPDDLENSVSVRVIDTQVTANSADDVYDEELDAYVGGRGSGLWFGYVDNTYVRHVAVQDNRDDGIAVLGGEVDIGWTTISGNEGHGLVLAGAADIPLRGDGPELPARPVRVINSTLSGNGVDEDYGSGVHIAGIEGADEPVHAEFVHATITENQAAVTGVGGTVTAISSVLARNDTDDCAGLVKSLGHNLLGPNCVLEFADGDINYQNIGGVDEIGLGPLDDNGGLSEWHRDGSWDDVVWEVEFRAEHEDNLRTHAPLDDTSPLIDAADPETCPRTDQRQVVRPLGPACDIGATEWAEKLAQPWMWISGDTWVLAGSEFVIQPTLSSGGPDSIEQATLEVTLPSEIGFVSSDDDCEYFDDSHVAVCQFSNIEPFDTARAEIRLQAPAEAGSFEGSFKLAALSPQDPNPNPYHEDVLWFEIYEEPDPDPDPTFEDSDGDGIHDAIDEEPDADSSRFRHGVDDDDLTTPTTFGEIWNRWGHLVTAQPDPARPDPEDARVRMDVIGTFESTNLPAELIACGSRMYVRPLSAVIVRCGSLIVEVVEAEEPVEVEASDGTTIAIAEGVSTYVNDDENGTVIVEHRGGDEPITITLPDGTALILPDGAGAKMSRDADGVYTVTHLGGGGNIEVLDPDGDPVGTIGFEASADTTPPVATVTGIADGETYTFGSVPEPGCTTSDEGSGVQIAAQPVITGGADDGTGLYTATCEGATDWAGNTAEPVSVTYTVQPSLVQECAGKRATIVGPAIGDIVNGTNGNDVIWVPAGTHTINAYGGNDTICAGAGDKVIDAGDGNDAVYAGDGNNTIKGGAGNDTIVSGSGDDGGDGNDTIDAGGGANALIGGAGNDKLTAGSGNDHIDGGDGNDTINAGDGVNTISGGAGNDAVTSGAGDDVIVGDAGNDTIRAGGGNDEVDGGAGNDQLYGEDGDDTITGGDGNDRLDGGPGSNPLHGGAGNNTCVLGSPESTNCKV